MCRSLSCAARANTILCLPQYVFIQDFPPATPGVETVKLRAGEKPTEAFPAVLVAALRATGVEEALAMMIRQGVGSFPFLPTLSFPSFPLALAHGMLSPAAHRPPAPDSRSLCGHSESGDQVDSTRAGLGLEQVAGGAGIERAGEVGGVGRSAWGAEVCISFHFVLAPSLKTLMGRRCYSIERPLLGSLSPTLPLPPPPLPSLSYLPASG
jgi:hypothetical protein